MTYERIKQLAKQKQVTLIELAKQTKISINRIKNWGRGVEITEKDLITLAQYFNVSIDYLVGYAEDPQIRMPNLQTIVDELEEIQSFVAYKIEKMKQKI